MFVCSVISYLEVSSRDYFVASDEYVRLQCDTGPYAGEVWGAQMNPPNEPPTQLLLQWSCFRISLHQSKIVVLAVNVSICMALYHQACSQICRRDNLKTEAWCYITTNIID